MFDQFHDVKEKADKGNTYAKSVLQSWANAEWFTSRPEVPESIMLTVFKVAGEINTDDLSSPAPDAWSRPDIPLHALAMHKNPRPGITPEEEGKRGPIKFIDELKGKRQSGRLRRRRGRHGVVTQVSDQLGAVVYGAKTFHLCRISVLVVFAWAQKLRLSSTTPWKTRAHCLSNST